MSYKEIRGNEMNKIYDFVIYLSLAVLILGLLGLAYLVQEM
jgi:hypothetical protein